MYSAQFDLIGFSDLMFGQHVQETKKSSETHVQFEKRTWKQKVRTTEDGQLYLNPFALKNGLESAGKHLGKKIPSSRGATYTDRFRKGTQAAHKLLLFGPKSKPLTIDDVEPLTLFVPSDGKRGSGTRVDRIFPTVHEWQVFGADLLVYDDKIDEETLLEHLVELGRFIGFGSMRVESGGDNGRFKVENLVTKPLG